MKRYFAVILSVIICIGSFLIVAGCSKEEIDIAFVTSLDTSDINSAAANCLSGVVSYSDINKLSYKQYSGDCKEQINTAADNGADIIVVFGADDESVVYSCAVKYPDIKFICVDFGDDFLVRPNIVCFNVTETQYAVYAGYSAVKEGNLIVGIQGEETAETYNYIRGVIEGAQIAAVEIGVKKNPVQIYYNISGTDMIAERMASWIENGCKVILCTDSTYEPVTECITDTDICSVISLGANRTNESKIVIASAYADYSSVVYKLLETAYNGEYNGGTMFSAGVKDGAVDFSYEPSAFGVMTASDIDALSQIISETDLSDYSSYRTPSDKGYSKIVLTEQGIISKTEENE